MGSNFIPVILFQVHIYAQEMHSKVYSIGRDQKEHRKSLRELRRKQHYNKHNRLLLTPLIEHTINHIIINHDKPKSEIGTDNNQNTEEKLILPSIDMLNASNDNRITRTVVGNQQKELMPSLRPVMEISEIIGSSKETSIEMNINEKADGNETVKHKIKGKLHVHNKHVTSKGKSKLNIKSISAEVLLPEAGQIDNDHLKIEENELPLKSKTEIFQFPVTKTRKHPRRVSETASFMQLVRLKNQTGLTKNLEVIDKLINDSKMRNLAYLKRTKKEDNYVDKVDGKVDNATSQNDNIKSNDNIKVEKEVKSNVNLPQIKLPPQTTESQPSISINPSHDVSRRRSSFIPNKALDKFLQNEKMKMTNYKNDVTWQESLAAIKDVRRITNEASNFEKFALEVFQE